MTVTTTDISFDGLFVHTEESLPIGELLQIELIPREFEPIRLLVITRYTGRKSGRIGVGVKVHRVDSDVAGRWSAFCENLFENR